MIIAFCSIFATLWDLNWEKIQVIEEKKLFAKNYFKSLWMNEGSLKSIATVQLLYLISDWNCFILLLEIEWIFFFIVDQDRFKLVDLEKYWRFFCAEIIFQKSIKLSTYFCAIFNILFSPIPHSFSQHLTFTIYMNVMIYSLLITIHHRAHNVYNHLFISSIFWHIIKYKTISDNSQNVGR